MPFRVAAALLEGTRLLSSCLTWAEPRCHARGTARWCVSQKAWFIGAVPGTNATLAALVRRDSVGGILGGGWRPVRRSPGSPGGSGGSLVQGNGSAAGWTVWSRFCCWRSRVVC